MRMSKMKRAARRTAAEWVQIVERYEHYGMPMATFADKEGVGPKRLRIWRARLRRRGIGIHRATLHHNINCRPGLPAAIRPVPDPCSCRCNSIITAAMR